MPSMAEVDWVHSFDTWKLFMCASPFEPELRPPFDRRTPFETDMGLVTPMHASTPRTRPDACSTSVQRLISNNALRRFRSGDLGHRGLMSITGTSRPEIPQSAVSGTLYLGHLDASSGWRDYCRSGGRLRSFVSPATRRDPGGTASSELLIHQMAFTTSYELVNPSKQSFGLARK